MGRRSAGRNGWAQPAHRAAPGEQDGVSPGAPRAPAPRRAIASRYSSAVPWAARAQVKRSRTRARPAAPSRARRSGSPRTRPRAAARAPASPGGTARQVSPSGPATSGIAPPVVATSGVPVAMASAAGSENPSYSEGTQETWAERTRSTSSASLMPLTNSTAPSRPYRSMARATGPSSARLPTTTRCASGFSVRSLASASIRWIRPLRGTSALEVVTIRPGTSATEGSGDQRSVSAPMWTTRTRSSRTPRCSTISRREVPETVSTDGRRRATRFCMVVKAYQRRTERRRFQVSAASRSRPRSTVMGWWIVVTRGAPSAGAAEESVPEGLVVVDDVEVAAAGGEHAAGPQGEGERLGEAAGPHGGDFEGVDPVAVLVALRGPEGVRGAVEVEAGDLGERHALVEGRVRLGADDLDGVAEAGELAGEVPDVDALAPAEGVPLVREESDPQRGGPPVRARPRTWGTSPGPVTPCRGLPLRPRRSCAAPFERAFRRSVTAGVNLEQVTDPAVARPSGKDRIYRQVAPR